MIRVGPEMISTLTICSELIKIGLGKYEKSRKNADDLCNVPAFSLEKLMFFIDRDGFLLLPLKLECV